VRPEGVLSRDHSGVKDVEQVLVAPFAVTVTSTSTVYPGVARLG